MSYRRHLRASALKAAYDMTVEKGWNRVRVADVAAEIGVSRPMLYKEFGDKQGLGDALVLNEAERFLLGIQAVLDEHFGQAADAITESVWFTLHEAEVSPLLKAVLTASRSGGDEGTGVLPLIATSASLLELASERLVDWFMEHFPELVHQDVVDGVDALIRLTVSHLVLPTADTTETGRRISQVALRYLALAPNRDQSVS